VFKDKRFGVGNVFCPWWLAHVYAGLHHLQQRLGRVRIVACDYIVQRSFRRSDMPFAELQLGLEQCKARIIVGPGAVDGVSDLRGDLDFAGVYKTIRQARPQMAP
jgi:hypothetical protein